ncbi:MAG: ATP-binding protein [Myxococcaceae bacterium]|nr:ATP-binding protein [Myxococcaceae bacterium]
MGPRQVGKSTLMKALNPDLSINLADEGVFFRYSADPRSLRQDLDTASRLKLVLVDEVQRLPSVLNTLQAIIDEGTKTKFLLTGSSARKLRRGNANLLPGRLLHFQMGPLVSAELEHRLDTRKALRLGTLPEVYLGKDEGASLALLNSYVASYIREEIKAEALVRNLEAFTRFTSFAFQQAGQTIDYSKLARSARVSRHALSRFYEIFEDTLVGERVWPFPPLREQADLVKHPKFYVFDVGVYNAMLGNFEPSADRIGALAEHLIFSQLRHACWAKNVACEVHSFRTRGGTEVDFIATLERQTFALEVKSTDNVSEVDVAGLKTFLKLYPKTEAALVLHLGARSFKVNGIWCHPWQKGLQEEMGL